MHAKVIISIQTVLEANQDLSPPVSSGPVDKPKTHWQFSAERLSSGSLIHLLLHLESLGFDIDR